MPKFQANFHLYAEDLDRAIKFYGENFDFKLLDQINKPGFESWAALQIENAILWLGPNGAKSGLIILIDSDIELWVSQLIQNKMEFLNPDVAPDQNQNVFKTEWGKHAWFLDSEKNRIMLFQPLELESNPI